MKRYAIVLVCMLSCPVASANNDEVQAGIFQTYLKLAEEGDINAQYITAHRYEIGKGTSADIDKAFFWYDRAAAKGHPLARRKIDERNAAMTPAPVPAAVAAAEAPKPVPVSAKPAVVKARAPAKPKESPRAPAVKAIATTPEPAKPHAKNGTLVAKAATEQPAPTPSINMIATVLGGQWSRNRQPAEFLPSTRAACLQSRRAEIVCFSGELTRNVAGQGVTYNVKTTLSGLDNPEGRFALSYVYNVLHVASKPDPEALVADTGDLQARTGWQEPGHTLDCRFNDARSMACARADRNLTYQFARD